MVITILPCLTWRLDGMGHGLYCFPFSFRFITLPSSLELPLPLSLPPFSITSLLLADHVTTHLPKGVGRDR